MYLEETICSINQYLRELVHLDQTNMKLEHLSGQSYKELIGVTCIFTGYILESKAQRLYEPIAKKIIISQDVNFIKNKQWDGLVDKSIRTSSKVHIIAEEHEVRYQHDKIVLYTDNSKQLRIALDRNKQKEKQPQTA